MLHIIKTCDRLVESPKGYCLVYLHSSMSSANKPDNGWLKKMYQVVFTRKYKKNLKAFYIVHPTFWVKCLFWFMTPFLSKKFWRTFDCEKLFMH